MDSFKFREADELVSALQNDVEGIILSLRGDGKKEEKVGVPAGFSGLPFEYYKYQVPFIDRIEKTKNGFIFYGRGQKQYACNIVDDFIRDREIELKVRETIDEIANEVYRNTVIQSMKDIGMVR